MTKYIKSVLVDTNVWLDNYLGKRAGRAIAASLIDCCQDHGIDMLVAVHSLRDVYYNVAADIKRQARLEGLEPNKAFSESVESVAWSIVLNLLELATVVPADISDVNVARYYHQVHRDFEDDLILAAVERSGANYLVTSDMQFIRHAPVAAISPQDMLMLLGVNV